MNLKVGITHGAGYVGRELIALVDGHPFLDLVHVSSVSHTGEEIWKAHPTLRGVANQTFEPVDIDSLYKLDVVVLAGRHGTSFETAADLIGSGFDGILVDMTSDFRYPDSTSHLLWNGSQHPNPDLLGDFAYGLPEVVPPDNGNGDNHRLIANPGCFATAVSLALWPISQHLSDLDVHVTAMTGASGAGSRPTPTTHFPRREGNARAYDPLTHRHIGEVLEVTRHRLNVAFVPVSAPWTRGIWGTAQITLSGQVDLSEVTGWFHHAYDDKPFVRFWDDRLPELGFSVGTPFCDLGLTKSGSNLVVVFALDNLLKGAASQAIQNINRAANLPEETGLVPPVASSPVPTHP